MQSLTVSATAHGLNYLPQYVAKRDGLFAANGLDVAITVCNPWDGVMHDLADGTADLALGGLWVPAMYEGKGRDFVAVCQLNDRFPMCILTRDHVPDFELAWLSGKTVLAPGQGGTAPAEFTRGLMREAGARPAETRFVHDLSMQMLRELFIGGLGDAFITDLVTATELERAGQGRISFRHAEQGGRMPNSVYYTLRERLDELTPRLAPFVRSIDQAMSLLTSGEAHDLEGLCAQEWPALDFPLAEEVTEMLIENGTWATPAIDRQACERWTGILHAAGLTVSHVQFDDIVDTRAVDALAPAGV